MTYDMLSFIVTLMFAFLIGLLIYPSMMLIREFIAPRKIDIKLNNKAVPIVVRHSTEPPSENGPIRTYVIEQRDNLGWWPVEYKKTNDPRKLIHEQKRNCRVRRISKWEYDTQRCC